MSLLVIIEGDPLNTQHAQEEGEEEEEEAVFIRGVNTNEDPPNAQEEEVVVFTRENRGGSAQHATRATPIRSSHGPMRA